MKCTQSGQVRTNKWNKSPAGFCHWWIEVAGEGAAPNVDEMGSHAKFACLLFVKLPVVVVRKQGENKGLDSLISGRR